MERVTFANAWLTRTPAAPSSLWVWRVSQALWNQSLLEIRKMEFIKSNDVLVLTNEGVESHQLLSPHNSKSDKVTITHVIIEPGSSQPRHKHSDSEQIWIALSGNAKLLLENDSSIDFHQGDIVRFEIKEIHGLLNQSSQKFEYMTVTSPPMNFESSYSQKLY